MLVAIYNMSKMKLIMERWKRTEKTLNEDHCFQRDTPAYGRDEWSFMDALNEPAMDRDDTPEFELSDDMQSVSIPGQTTPSGRSVGGRTVGTDTFLEPEFANMTPAPREDLVDNFNDAFGLARSQGKVEFNYRGKPYTTQLDTESDIDWSQNLGMSLWDLHARQGKIQAMPGGGTGTGLKRHLAQKPNPEAPSGYDAPGRSVEEMEQDYLKSMRPMGESKKPTKKYKLRLKG
jgi:hypothetical protein